MPEHLQNQIPLILTILSCLVVLFLIAILVFLYLIEKRLSGLSAKVTKSTRSTKLAEAEDIPQSAEVQPGTRFEEFLKEDPMRQSFAKREQFKGYRDWRKEKGLNWDPKEKERFEEIEREENEKESEDKKGN